MLLRESRVFRRFLFLFVAAALALTAGTADAARKKHRSAPQVDRYASIVMEADTGLVLSERNPDKKLYPASLTKMMTLYLTFEAIENGRLQKYSRIAVSRRAAAQEPSKLGLQAGSSIRVEDAILALVTKSANDVAVMLAEAVGGSETRFAALMTQKARALGMANTRFVNASGLHHPAQVSSARDMALLGQALIRDFPRHYRYFSTASFTFAGKTYNNHNHLMKTYRGMDGLKTGYVNASGYNLTASATRNGTRLIGVVFGGKTTRSRNDHMAQLLDTGFAKASDARVASLISQRRKASAAGKQIVSASAAAIGRKIPLRKPASAASPYAYDTAAPSETSPQFDAMGLAVGRVVEQGDADVTDAPSQFAENRVVSMKTGQAFVQEFQPRPLNTTAMAQVPVTGAWSVQVGAFSSHAAGMSALQTTRGKLPSHVAGGSQYLIAPLMTNRGMIYRARLSGLAREQATQACRILQGNCLILAAR